MTDTDADRVAGSDLLVHVRHDRPERQAEFQQADHNFTQQELELKTNTELTCEIHRLTTELHRRLIDHRTGPEKRP